MTDLTPIQGSLYKDKKILVVCATSKTNKEDTTLYKSLIHQKNSPTVEYITQNKTGLCKLYNTYITNEWDCVIYVHDDVYIDSVNFIDKVFDGFKKFDVCGLAGGSSITVKKPLLWHLMTSRDSQSGIVCHRYLDSYLPSVFGPIGKQVVLLDGLFLAIQPNILIKNNVKFDENITGFHHYDLKFCIDCYRAGITLGTVPIHVIHESPGLKDFSNEYLKSEEYFYKKLRKLYVKKQQRS